MNNNNTNTKEILYSNRETEYQERLAMIEGDKEEIEKLDEEFSDLWED